MAATTAVVNTVTGYTDPVQWTVTAGGTALEFYTPTLQAVTLVGCIVPSVWFHASATWVTGGGVEIAVCDGNGANAVVYGRGNFMVPNSTSAAAVSTVVAGQSTSITQGQRIRVRVYIDDQTNGLGQSLSGYTATLTYSEADVGSLGDCVIVFPVTLAEYVASTPLAPPFTRRDRRIVPLI